MEREAVLQPPGTGWQGSGWTAADHNIRTSTTMNMIIKMTNKLPPEGGRPNRV